MKQAPKIKRIQAERAAEWYAREVRGCVVTRRPIRTKFQAVDFFGADVLGKTADGTNIFIQVTAGQHSAVAARRKKLETIPWHHSDIVVLLQLRQTEDPANARKTLWFFRVHELCCWEWLTEPKATEVPIHWFTAGDRVSPNADHTQSGGDPIRAS